VIFDEITQVKNFWIYSNEDLSLKIYFLAQWVAENTHFDRLYFYGKDKPIHTSIGPEQKSEIVIMKPGKVRLIPSVVKKDKFLALSI